MSRHLALVLMLGALAAGCGPTVDLADTLEVHEVSSAWWDAGIVDGQNKLVPMITFKLTNHSDQTLNQLQINVLFRRVTEPEVDWGSGFLINPVPEGLAPGATTDSFTVKSQLGYKGTDPRDVMMRSQYFIDAKVDVFAKYSSVQWKKVGEFPVAREMVAP
ncbi:MAG: hypothetical protein IT176_09945 [Acidobacteria bacterium]|nr:hypothetical protein [Acidobacteriota bacterium]